MMCYQAVGSFRSIKDLPIQKGFPVYSMMSERRLECSREEEHPLVVSVYPMPTLDPFSIHRQTVIRVAQEVTNWTG